MVASENVSRRSGSADCKGFTLVELLVVIGIIAVLISILLPSLAKARQAANKVACGSNMRQIGQMFAMYESDNKGKWPLARNGSSTASWTTGYRYGAIWPHAISPKGEPSNSIANGGWTFDDYDNYVAAPKTFVCPAQAQDPNIQRTYVLVGAAWGQESAPAWHGNTNTMNMAFAYFPPGYPLCVGPSRQSGKLRASETIMMAEMKVDAPLDANPGAPDGLRKFHMGGNIATVRFDELIIDPWWGGAQPGIRAPWAHEWEGANYLFADGHVEYQQSPVRYHAGGMSQEEFDNPANPHSSAGSIAWSQQFTVDKEACDPGNSGWWWDISNP